MSKSSLSSYTQDPIDFTLNFPRIFPRFCWRTSGNKAYRIATAFDQPKSTFCFFRDFRIIKRLELFRYGNINIKNLIRKTWTKESVLSCSIWRDQLWKRTDVEKQNLKSNESRFIKRFCFRFEWWKNCWKGEKVQGDYGPHNRKWLSVYIANEFL